MILNQDAWLHAPDEQPDAAESMCETQAVM